MNSSEVDRPSTDVISPQDSTVLPTSTPISRRGRRTTIHNIDDEISVRRQSVALSPEQGAILFEHKYVFVSSSAAVA